jgi:beta-aspartyl-peptidase (threonine type)
LIPKILVHGGAGDWTGIDEGEALDGVRAAARAGWSVLNGGGSALDAVEAATVILEDHPLFDAGYGSFVNRDGEVEMDALIADGSTVNFGAVAAVRRVKNVIRLARMVMTHTDNCFFAADGADQLAAELGIPLIANIELVTDKELALFRERVKGAKSGVGMGTVGAVSIDSSGKLASATSTGGTPNKPKGRVGDSPIFGAGGYANGHGAASGTGIGEQIMRFLLCKEAVDRARDGLSASEATQAAIRLLADNISDSQAGIIMVDAVGRLGACHSTQAMPVAWVDGDGEIGTRMRVNGWV